MSSAGVASIAATPKPAHSIPGPTGPTVAGPRPAEAPDRRHQHQAEQADAAVDQHDGRRERLGPGGRRRVGDADDVAADVARQEIVEERRDEKR